MSNGLKYILLIVMLYIPSAFTNRNTDYRDGRYKNVCKDLKGEVLLYFIFVDTKTTSPWTEFDIISTIDSIHVATRWLENQAKKYKIDLEIKTDYYIGDEFTTINRNLPRGTLKESVESPNLQKGMNELNKWADNISLKVGSSLQVKNKDGIPQSSNPKNAERLIAFLRDEYAVESVALLFMVNNYFRSDISFALNTLDTENVEFGIVSYKYPSEIAHIFLHLYGAADMYSTPLRKSQRKIRIAAVNFPDDIMQDPYGKKIMNLGISEFTRYLIGWTDELDSQYENLLTD
jgi:hypothetical protein